MTDPVRRGTDPVRLASAVVLALSFLVFVALVCVAAFAITWALTR